MRYDTALTYAGALQILGRRDDERSERLSRALGGLNLAAGASPALTSTAAKLPPQVLLASVWAWIDQKNEAMTVLRDLWKESY